MAEEGTGDIDKGTGNGDPKGDALETQKTPEANAGKGPPATVKHEAFGELEADTAEWLSKRDDIKDVKTLAKIARDKDSMVGRQAEQLAKAIVKPGPDATPEEKLAYREKMGIGKSADDYEFAMPKDLPEDLPYDGDRAKSFATLADAQELTKAQAQAIHDWAVQNAVGDFKGAQTAQQERDAAIAKTETEKLVKQFGPLEGEAFRANAAFADKALMLGGAEATQELIDKGLISEIDGKKVVKSAALFNLFAKVGQSLYQEDTVLKGNPNQLGNPFADGESENITEQGRLLNSDRPRALALIAAAGKKPTDFGAGA